MGLKEQKSITNIINMAGLIFFMFDNGSAGNGLPLSCVVSCIFYFVSEQ